MLGKKDKSLEMINRAKEEILSVVFEFDNNEKKPKYTLMTIPDAVCEFGDEQLGFYTEKYYVNKDKAEPFLTMNYDEVTCIQLGIDRMLGGAGLPSYYHFLYVILHANGEKYHMRSGRFNIVQDIKKIAKSKGIELTDKFDLVKMVNEKSDDKLSEEIAQKYREEVDKK